MFQKTHSLTERMKNYIGRKNPRDFKILDLEQAYFGEPNKEFQTFLSKFKNLVHLIISQTFLRSVFFLPPITTLKVLEISNNFLREDEIEEISLKYPSLCYLDISNNTISSFIPFQSFSNSKLSILIVKGNPFCTNRNYSTWLFNTIRTLNQVDDIQKGNTNLKRIQVGQIILDENEQGKLGREDNPIIIQDEEKEEPIVIEDGDEQNEPILIDSDEENEKKNSNEVIIID